MILKIKDRKVILLKHTDTHLQFLNEIQIPGMDINPELSIAKILYLLRSVRAFKEDVYVIPHRYDVSVKNVLPITKELQAVATVSDDSYCQYDIQNSDTVIMYDIPNVYLPLMDALKEQSLTPSILPIARQAQAVISHIQVRTMVVTLERNFVEYTIIQDTIQHTERIETHLTDFIMKLEGCNEDEVIEYITGYIEGTLPMPDRVKRSLDNVYKKFEELRDRFLPFAIAIIGTYTNVIPFEETPEFPLVKITPDGAWTEGLNEEIIQEVQPLLFPLAEFEMLNLEVKKGKKVRKTKTIKDDTDINNEEFDNDNEGVNEEDPEEWTGLLDPEEGYETDQTVKPKPVMRRTDPNTMRLPGDMADRVVLNGQESYQEDGGITMINMDGSLDTMRYEQPHHTQIQNYEDDGYDDGYQEDQEEDEEFAELFEENIGKKPKRSKKPKAEKENRSKKGRNKMTNKSNKPFQKNSKILSTRVIAWSLGLSLLIVGGIFFYYADPLSLFNHTNTDQYEEQNESMEQEIDQDSEAPQVSEEDKITRKEQKVADIQVLKDEMNLSITDVEDVNIDGNDALAVTFTNITMEEIDRVLSTLAGKYTLQTSTVDNGVLVYVI